MAGAYRILGLCLMVVGVVCLGVTPFRSAAPALSPPVCACCCTLEHDGAMACCEGLPASPRLAEGGAETDPSGCRGGGVCSCCAAPEQKGDAPIWMILGGCAPVRIAARSDVEAVLAPMPVLVRGGGVTPGAVRPLAVKARLVLLGVRTT